MSNHRTLVSLVVVLIAVFLIVKLDLFPKVKDGVTNMIYGNEMMEIKGLRVVIELLLPDLEKEGLAREAIRQELSDAIEKAGIKSLTEEEWQKLPDKPTLNAAINAIKVAEGRYQYNVVIEVIKRKPLATSGYAVNGNTFWRSSGMGEGDVSDIRARITQEMGSFLKAREK